MSIRFDAAGDYIYRAANIPAGDPLTLSFWMYISTDVNAAGILFILTNGGGTQYETVMLDVSGTRLRIETQNGGSTNLTDLTVGQWYHVAYVRNGASHTIYLDNTSHVTFTDNTTITSPAAIYMASNTVSYLNGRLADIRIWTAALTQSELLDEMRSQTAVRTSNLHGDWRTPSGASRLNDSSGNGYNFSSGGTLADEADPPYTFTYNLTVAEGSSASSGDAVSLSFYVPATNITVADGNSTSSGDPVILRKRVSSIKLGIIGDSGMDEYRADDARGGAYSAVTFNPVEMMTRILGTAVVQPGAWGTRATPRRTGYENNWALSAVTAGSSFNGGGNSIVSPDQTSGLAAQVTGGTVDYVVIWCGANDFAEWNSTYNDIYDGSLSGANLTTKLNSIITNIQTAMDAVINAGALCLVTSISDIGNDPGVQSRFPNATFRARVTSALGTVNAGIVSSIAARPNSALADKANLATSLYAEYPDQGGGSINVDGEVVTYGSGDEPHHMLLSDDHTGSILSGIIANQLIIDRFNAAFYTAIPRLTNAQIANQIRSTTNLTVAEGNSTSTGDAIGLGVLYPRTVAEGTSTSTGDPVVLGVLHRMIVAEGASASSGDAVVLGVLHSVTVAEGNSTSTGDAIVLGVLHRLVVAEGTSTSTGDALSLTFSGAGSTTITVAEGASAVSGDPVVMTVIYQLTVAEGTSTVSGDAILLGVLYRLVVAEGTSAVSGDPVTLTYTPPGGAISIVEGNSAVTGDPILLGVRYPLTVADGTSTSTGDVVLLILASLILHGNRKLYSVTRTSTRVSTRETSTTNKRQTYQEDD